MHLLHDSSLSLIPVHLLLEPLLGQKMTENHFSAVLRKRRQCGKLGLLLQREAPLLNHSQLFKWRHFQAEIILLCVRWYLRYALNYRHLEELMLERGLHIDHTTIYVRRFGVGEISPTGRSG